MSNKGLSVDKVIKSKTPKKRETWSQTKRTGENTEEIQVEKLDNKGYLVTVSKSYYDSKQNWHRKESKLFSEKNPLDNDENNNPVDSLFDSLSGFKI